MKSTFGRPWFVWAYCIIVVVATALYTIMDFRNGSVCDRRSAHVNRPGSSCGAHPRGVPEPGKCNMMRGVTLFKTVSVLKIASWVLAGASFLAFKVLLGLPIFMLLWIAAAVLAVRHWSATTEGRRRSDYVLLAALAIALLYPVAVLAWSLTERFPA